MGCGCGGGTTAAAKTAIKYEYEGKQFSTREEAHAARTKAGGQGRVRTVAVRI